ncbi:unnamed protein product [Chironomus riparius]|uniref:Spastin n=1 Tax=Chironomus riparius TaxID=315576 RepID=A0A9N9WPV4_9DIPT|nr:unnamed protein product [Chironomus riparius]
MVRKTKNQTDACPSKNSGNDSDKERKTFLLLSFPIILVFNVLKTLLFELFIILKFVYNTSSRILNKPSNQTEEVNLETVNGSEDIDTSMDMLQRQKYHHKRAFEYISQALKIDETQNSEQKEIAINLYQEGINELSRGINIDVWQGTGEKWIKAQRLHDKMQTNLAMAKDRLNFLELMMSERTKLLNQERRKVAANVQSVTDKMNRLTNRKSSLQKPYLVNEYACSDKGEKVVTFNNTKNSNHSTSKTTSSSEATGKLSSRRPANLTIMNKSQTLPRNMSRALTHVNNTTIPKKPATPPAVRRQFSASGSSSPRKTNFSGRATPPLRSRTPQGQQPTQNIISVKGVEQKLVQTIMDEIIEGGQKVEFNDIAGNEAAKQALKEMVILPAVRPELFTGLRTPAKGLLLFGPPGNGKTLLARAVANECAATFFSISAASLTSKYVGDGEKMVRALFSVARELQPSIIFIDEIDSLLSERSQSEHEASRRLKTEFLIQFDGLPTNSTESEKIVVMAATNRPTDLDEAALRRFPKRVYVTLPDFDTRLVLLSSLLQKQNSPLKEDELKILARATEGYSGSDLTALARDAALEPIRGLDLEQVKEMDLSKVRSITMSDFHNSLKRIRKSVSPASLKEFERWSQEYGVKN